MKETSLEIPIQNTALAVHGILRGEYSDPMVILAPGLGGWMNDLLLYNAARHFESVGISSLRISFYGHAENQRDIKDCDVKTFAQDLDEVVDYIGKQAVRWIGVIGHSYSGMGIVYSKRQQFNAAVLWDPSHTDSYDDPQAKQNLKEDFIYLASIDSYASGSGPGYVMSRKVFENHSPRSAEQARSFKIPSLVINADHSQEMKKYGKDYVESFNANSEQVIIPSSSHSFTEDGVMEELFKTTSKWLRQRYELDRSIPPEE